MKLNHWDVEDVIRLVSKEVKICGSYESPRNNGKSMIISKVQFEDIYKDYYIDHLNLVVGKGNVSMEELKQFLEDDNVEIMSAKYIRDYDFKNSGQFIRIFKLLNTLYLLVFWVITMALFYSNRREQIESDKYLLA